MIVLFYVTIWWCMSLILSPVAVDALCHYHGLGTSCATTSPHCMSCFCHQLALLVLTDVTIWRRMSCFRTWISCFISLVGKECQSYVSRDNFFSLGYFYSSLTFYGLVVRMDRSVYRACWVRDPHINFGTWGVRIFHFLVSFWKFFNSGCFQLFCYLPSVSGWELCWVRQLKVCPFYRGNNGEDGTWILVLSQVNTV